MLTREQRSDRERMNEKSEKRNDTCYPRARWAILLRSRCSFEAHSSWNTFPFGQGQSSKFGSYGSRSRSRSLYSVERNPHNYETLTSWHWGQVQRGHLMGVLPEVASFDHWSKYHKIARRKEEKYKGEGRETKCTGPLVMESSPGREGRKGTNKSCARKRRFFVGRICGILSIPPQNSLKFRYRE